MTDLLTVEEVAARLKVSPRAIRQWASQRRIPCSRFGKLYRFTEEDVAEMIAMNRQRVLRFVKKAA